MQCLVLVDSTYSEIILYPDGTTWIGHREWSVRSPVTPDVPAIVIIMG